MSTLLTVYKNSSIPIPQPGDKFECNSKWGHLYILAACDCSSCKGAGWPLGPRCGVHLNELTGRIIWVARNNKWLEDGIIYRDNPVNPVNNLDVVVTVSQHSCPLCKQPGDDLVFSFYCSNSKCRNYHK
jgi:hypothetical protein